KKAWTMCQRHKQIFYGENSSIYIQTDSSLLCSSVFLHGI
uniref:Ovule protein n=1 Tax=Globodera pallida TaxID=36090 RepID=A0A183CTH6_GLOPA